jgi:hypothetical protein
VYAPRRAEWLEKTSEAGVLRRAEFYYRQFDALAALRQVARRELHEPLRHQDRNRTSGFDCPHRGSLAAIRRVRLWDDIGMFAKEDRNFLVDSRADIHSAMDVIGRLVPINLSGS